MIHELRYCNRCGYEWDGRLERTPKTCPHCRSPYWNRERKRPVKQGATITFEV